MQNRQDQLSEVANSTKLISSVLAGITSNAVTHPLTVLSHHCVVSKRDALIDVRNMKKPFAGFGAALFYGPVISGAFYFMQDYFGTTVTPAITERYALTEYQGKAVSFVPLGLTYGFTVSSIMAVQRQVWQGLGTTFLSTMSEMYTQGGTKSFFKGLKIGLIGGITFTSTYQTVRHILEQRQDDEAATFSHSLVQNAAASFAASAVNAPLNYFRMQQQISSPAEKTPTMREIAARFYNETTAKKGLLKRFGYFCRQIDIAPSIYRNAIGVLVGQLAYDCIKDKISDYSQRSSKAHA